MFGYAVVPHSWKQYQLPAELQLWRAVSTRTATSRADAGARRQRRATPSSAPARASSTRSASSTGCWSAARMSTLHDRARREGLFVVAVQLRGGRWDLLLRLDEHRAGGRARLRPRPRPRCSTSPGIASSSRSAPSSAPRCSPRCRMSRPPTPTGRGRRRPRPDRVADGPGARRDGIKELLYRNYDHARWDEVADAASRAATARWYARPASVPRSRT